MILSGDEPTHSANGRNKTFDTIYDAITKPTFYVLSCDKGGYVTLRQFDRDR